MIPFDDEADAVRLANDTPYGLSGSIWTRTAPARFGSPGRRLRLLSVNSNSSVRVQTPFGGFKQSGFGRELGMHALDGYPRRRPSSSRRRSAMGRLDGKVCVITGAGGRNRPRGLPALLRGGGDRVVADVSAEAGEQTAPMSATRFSTRWT